MEEMIQCAIYSKNIEETKRLSLEEIKSVFKKAVEFIPGWNFTERLEPALINDEKTRQIRCFKNFSVEGDEYYHSAMVKFEKWQCLVLTDRHQLSTEDVPREEKIRIGTALKIAFQQKLHYPISVHIVQTIEIEDPFE